MLDSLNSEFLREKVKRMAQAIGAKRYNNGDIIVSVPLATGVPSYTIPLQYARVATVPAGHDLPLQKEDLWLITNVSAFVVNANGIPFNGAVTYNTLNTNYPYAFEGSMKIEQAEQILLKQFSLLNLFKVDSSGYANAASPAAAGKFDIKESAKVIDPYIVISGQKNNQVVLTYDQAVADSFSGNTRMAIKLSGTIFPSKADALATLETLITGMDRQNENMMP